jgi:hypothetical protein
MNSMFSEFLGVYTTIIVAILVLLAAAGVVATHAHRHGKRLLPRRSPEPPAPEVCPHCGGRGRFVDDEGREWPCVDLGYRH